MSKLPLCKCCGAPATCQTTGCRTPPTPGEGHREIKRLTDEIARLRVALEWYADPTDDGRKARTALGHA